MDVGVKVRITTAEGEYEGVVQSISKDTNKIGFEKMKHIQSGKSCGVLFFFRHEICSHTILGGGNHMKTANKKINPHVSCKLPATQVLKQFKTTSHSNVNPSASESIVKYSQGFHKDVLEFEGVDNDCNRIDYSLIKFHVPKLHHIITTDYECENALGVIEVQKLIGVAIEGACYKRSGDLYWIVISTYDHVFLFDILALKNKVFDLGLRAIFQNPSIQKVVHDCRLMSDIFYHQYQCNLCNVFDTQVADVFIQRNRHGEFSQRVCSLPHCLMGNLNLPPKAVFIQKVREQFLEQDLAVWKERPLPEALVNAAIKEVIYLIKLRQFLLDRMLEPYVYGVNVYLSTIKDCNDEEREVCQMDPSLLPQLFQELLKDGKQYCLHGRDAYNFKNLQVEPSDQHTLLSQATWRAIKQTGEVGKGPNKNNKWSHVAANEVASKNSCKVNNLENSSREMRRNLEIDSPEPQCQQHGRRSRTKKSPMDLLQEKAKRADSQPKLGSKNESENFENISQNESLPKKENSPRMSFLDSFNALMNGQGISFETPKKKPPIAKDSFKFGYAKNAHMNVNRTSLHSRTSFSSSSSQSNGASPEPEDFPDTEKEVVWPTAPSSNRKINLRPAGHHRYS